MGNPRVRAPGRTAPARTGLTTVRSVKLEASDQVTEHGELMATASLTHAHPVRGMLIGRTILPRAR